MVSLEKNLEQNYMHVTYYEVSVLFNIEVKESM